MMILLARLKKPKMILLNISGGGLRSCVFTFRTMQVIDSTLNGDLMNYSKLICGSSGGMISACYYRELFLNHHKGLMKANNERNNYYLKNIGKDMLNSIVFSTTVADIFMNMQNPMGAFLWRQSQCRNTVRACADTLFKIIK